MINHLKFCLKMIQHYEKEYPQLPKEIIADIVDEVLNMAPDSYFTWEQVQENPNFCKQCGACCRTLDCKYFNGRTCDEYATRYDACAEFPWYEINGKLYFGEMTFSPFSGFGKIVPDEYDLILGGLIEMNLN